jgi:HK97 family phage portal protein
MNLLRKLNNSIETKATPFINGSTLPLPLRQEYLRLGSDIVLYPQDNGERYLTKGLNLNDAVSTITGKNQRKAGQVRLTHTKVKPTEKKTLQEYLHLSSAKEFSASQVREMRIMRKAMIEDLVVDSQLTKLLNKPNRWQTQSEWIELAFGLRELQGEGNLWLNRGPAGGKVLEMMVIPKPHLNLIGDNKDPWNVVAYEFNLSGKMYRWNKEDVIMWKYSNPRSIDMNLEHLRGRSPLYSLMVLIQGMNEGDERIAISNKHAGASGLAYRTDLLKEPSLEQKADMRTQFNNTINNEEMANKIAILGGQWGYIEFGKTMAELKILEQYGLSFQRVANAFETPHQLFGFGNDTYENQKQYGRKWIYNKIAPNMYNFRGILSDRLLPEFNLDPETNLIDCDVLSLPEMAQDLKELTEGLDKVYGMSINERLKYVGMEPVEDDAIGNLRLVPNGLTNLEEFTVPKIEEEDDDEQLNNL